MDARLRLSPEDWLRAGFAALVTEGPQALRAEALARALGTTKGSFYWHFADVPAFHAALLARWVAAAEQALPATLAGAATPAARLRLLGKVGTAALLPDLCDRPVEPALRAWAHAAPAAAAAVARVDAARLATIRGLLTEMDMTNPEIARLLLGAGIGLAELAARDGSDPTAPLESLVDLVLALR